MSEEIQRYEMDSNDLGEYYMEKWVSGDYVLYADHVKHTEELFKRCMDMYIAELTNANQEENT